ncbi:chromosome segregation ATPase [Paraburkholderia graminis]|uniref:DNA-binding protein n=1 Tax=Paraburkholderia graminis TaxID=60548 RepID=UPI0028574255|nr:DNA-binding protein [Paraburkholderia graminis]MDR6469878.1 chromosome segregation ATPase [Paraburkholderia graminis]
MSMETDIVTDERVAQIADRMAGEGKKVSALAIWGELRCGSIVAVSAAVERWRQARQPASAEAPASVMTGLPDDVAQTMLSAAGNLWASAREEAERVVNQRLALAGGHADALAAERDEALAEYQNTLAEAELARERVATLTNALSISEEAVNRLASELSALRDRAKTAEDRVAELEDRAAAAEARVAQTEEREAASEARVGEAEERALAAEARVARTEERASAAEERATETDERVRDAEGRVAHAEERASTAEARLAEAEQHASAVQARLEAAETSLTEERGAREALNAATVARDEEIARLIAERDAAHEKAVALGEAGEAHAREVQRWADESNAASSRAQDAALQASESLAQLAALQTELDQARAELAAERDAHAAHGDEAAAQRAEVERVQHELAAARDQLAAMSEANAAATAETTRLAQDASAATSRAQAAEQRVAELERQLAELETAHAQQQGTSPEGLSADDESKEAVMADEIASLRRQMTSQAKAHEKAYAELRTLAEQWIAHAKELKQRLSATNQKVTFLDARSAAEVALLRRLSSELERLKPDHDLISRDAQQKFISATLAERLEQKGYRYDPATAVMSKIEA